MKSITFDWNCYIAVENKRSQSDGVLRLVDMHRDGLIDVGILATSASENLKGSMELPASYSIFRNRIEAIGWGDLTVVKTLGYNDLTYYDHAFYASENSEQIVKDLWNVIAKPSVPYDVEAFRKHKKIDLSVPISDGSFKRWRNTWCDVNSVYAHIYSKRDIFVTTDRKAFQDNAEELKTFGLALIATPEEAVETLQAD